MIGLWRRARDAERALEVAETDRDIARAQHLRDLDTIAEALGVQTGPGLPVAAGPLAQVAGEVRRQARLVAGQRDRVEAELLAVDEALAAAGVDWTDNRATGIRDLAHVAVARQRPVRGDLADIARAATVRAHDSLCSEPRCVLAVDHIGLHWRPGEHWRACEPWCCLDREHAGVCSLDWDERRTGRRCTCRRRGLFAATDHVDPRCPAHSPGHRYGGRPARPLTLPSDPWCSADLDGARCARPAGHDEPCRPVDPRLPPSLCGVAVDDGWCVRLAEHEGDCTPVGRWGARLFRAPALPSIARCGARDAPDHGQPACHQVTGHGGRHQNALGYEWDTGREAARHGGGS